ncbi:MAG: molybdate ABC transporter substrate-binding protein [Polyangiaceae bacterium]|nr:molybdate ABC transporter substrate-binding protein [Polyangiaceae bacterium]
MTQCSVHRRREHRVRRAVLALCVALLATCATACRRKAPADALSHGRLVVFAAASLREVFTRLGSDFEQAHPGVEVTFNFAGTQELRSQVEHGAAVDVFASADARHMDALLRDARVLDPVIFAGNEPVIVVSREAAQRVRTLAELPAAERIVLGAPEVPIGRYTVTLLDRANRTLGADFRARVEARVVSRELNVRQVLAKVSLGEAQAGIVYRTDALTAGASVTVVAIPSELNVVAEYPIAVAAGAPNPELARAWVALVLSPAGRGALAQAGFGTPRAGASP